MTARKMRRGTKQDRASIAGLVERGWPNATIAHELRLERHFVAYWSRHYRIYGDTEDLPRPGRPRTATAAVAQRVSRKLLSKSRPSTRTTAMELRAAGTAISATTVRRIAKELDLFAYRQQRKPLLTEDHKRRRLEFARRHQHMSIADWSLVLFVDETQRSIHATPNPQNDRVWLPRGQHPDPLPRVQATLSVRAAGGVSAAGKTALHLFHKRLTANDYVSVLQNTLLADGDRLFGGGPYTLLQDRSPVHTAAVVTEYLDGRHALHMTEEWPPHSPDLNIIENCWAIIKAYVAKQQPRTRDELEQAARAAWKAVPQAHINAMVQSMPDRLRAVIAARGSHTKY